MFNFVERWFLIMKTTDGGDFSLATTSLDKLEGSMLLDSGVYFFGSIAGGSHEVGRYTELELLPVMPRVDFLQDVIRQMVAEEMIVIFECRSGRMEVTTDEGSMLLTAGSVLVCSPLGIPSFVGIDDIDGALLAFPTARMSNLFFADEAMWGMVQYVRLHPVVRLDGDAWSIGEGYFDLLRMSFTRPTLKYRQALVNTLLNSLLLFLSYMVSGQCGECRKEEAIVDDDEQLFQHFMMLLSAHKGRLRTVKDCALLLSVSPKHLLLAVQKVSGRKALECVHAVACKEIEQALLFSTCSIKQIAVDFHFDNMSYFSRFFKTKYGMTPTAYRRAKSQE